MMQELIILLRMPVLILYRYNQIQSRVYRLINAFVKASSQHQQEFQHFYPHLALIMSLYPIFQASLIWQVITVPRTHNSAMIMGAKFANLSKKQLPLLLILLWSPLFLAVLLKCHFLRKLGLAVYTIWLPQSSQSLCTSYSRHTPF